MIKLTWHVLLLGIIWFLIFIIRVVSGESTQIHFHGRRLRKVVFGSLYSCAVLKSSWFTKLTFILLKTSFLDLAHF